jgi:hypothetical protein
MHACAHAVPRRTAHHTPHNTAPLAAAAGNGVFLLLLLNVVLFVLDHVLHVRGISGLYLNHARPQWYQVRAAHACVRALALPVAQDASLACL